MRNQYVALGFPTKSRLRDTDFNSEKVAPSLG